MSGSCQPSQLSSLSRIRVHKHLFTSLLFYSAISALLKFRLLALHQTSAVSEDILVEEDEVENIVSLNSTIASNNTQLSLWPPPACLILSVLARYFRSTNYFWMFNEALFLHKLLKYAFSTPPLRSLIIFAYSIPLITTATYIAVRAIDEDNEVKMKWITANNRTIENCLGNSNCAINGQNIEVIDENIDSCWLMPSTKSWHEWIINVPNCATLIVSFCSFSQNFVFLNKNNCKQDFLSYSYDFLE